MEHLRAEIDALASRITEVKRTQGATSEECKELVRNMGKLRGQLGKDDKAKKKEKVVELPYFEQRLAMVNQLGSMGAAYPHKVDVTMTIPQLRERYMPQLSEPGKRHDDILTIAGRIVKKRSSGSKLHFLSLQGDMQHVQIISTESEYSSAQEFAHIHSIIRRGDIVAVQGYPTLSKSGEFSLGATKITLLSTCFHMLPDDYFGLTSIEQRSRQRYLDLIVNYENMNTFLQRSKIIRFVRTYFERMNFVEVETPTLSSMAGGAMARPFITHHNELNQRMYLRIAPELYLKKLVVGGIDRVFEVGKQFRNEGIDLTHNPEFTSVEAYWAYHDYEDWMTTTEDMLHHLAIELHGSPIVKYAPRDNEGKPLPATEFNFSKPFKRLRVVPELEKRLNVSLANVDFEKEEGIAFLLSLCKQHNVECLPPHTAPRLLDALIAEYLEPECHDPCYICDHPRVMSPLAKWHRADPRLSERFELFVNKKELVNAYTELNNPLVQREEFIKQVQNRDKGDHEAMEIDNDFIRALEHGLPPTGGWGLGIDRLVMFMTSQSNIKEVLLFPAMKSEDRAGDATYPPGTQLNGQNVPLIGQ